jgi:phosphoribosyl 1,2-cyclic phosphodiesterase
MKVTRVFVTHLHGDQIKEPTLSRLVKEGVPIHCHHKIVRHLAASRSPLARAANLRSMVPFSSEMFRLGPFRVKSFEVPHDAPGGCYGFALYARTATGIRKIALATDIGSHDAKLVQRFANSDAIIIESNYDEAMLERSGRPQWLKDRIREVHFSNDQCTEFLREVLAKSTRLPRVLVQAHVSQECNTVDAAHRCVDTRVLQHHRLPPRVVSTYHLRESEMVTLE